MTDVNDMINNNAPEPQIWYCPSCKKLKTPEHPDGLETILGIQHGDTLVIKYKDLRVEIEAEGRVGVSCRVCGAYVEITSQDWEEIKKFKRDLEAARLKAGPPIRRTEIIGYSVKDS